MTTEFLRERTFEVNGLQIACKEWGRPGFTQIIALHGWLDNAASFDHLIPLMNNVHVIALDMMGHGKSSHRSADSFYEPWIDVGDVISVADQMLWDEFTLLGHSRGAIISAFIAGTFPERIKNLFLIDGYVPYLHSTKKSGDHLKRAIKENRRFGVASPTYFRDFERAVHARVEGFVPLTYQAALTLAKRGVFEDANGFFWGNDQRLKASNHIKFSEEQIRNFYENIIANVILILAENSAIGTAESQEKFFDWIPQMQVKKLPGSHHLHLEDKSKDIALLLQTLLN